MKKLLLSVCFSLLLAVPSLSFAQGASQESVRKFLIVGGGLEVGMGPINDMLKDLRKMKLSKAKMTAIEKELSTDTLEAILTPVYQKHFTEQEIQELIKLYETPAGKKLVQTQGVVVRDAKIAAEEWSQGFMLRLEKILLQ